MATRPTPNRLPGLDGLRAVAVLLIVLFHQNLLPSGWVGVQLFFVLSGYLITKLLAQDQVGSLGHYLRGFYGRRALRIFPLYFAFLTALGIAAWVVGGEGAAIRGLPYAATYTYNLWHASSAFVHSKYLTHFWSLCVEEQFYLVWPFLIYFCRSRNLGKILAGIFLAGPILRGLLYSVLSSTGLPVLDDPSVALYVLTPTHLDAFAVGGYFALFPFEASRRTLIRVLAFLAVAGALILIFSENAILSGSLAWATFGYPIGLAPGFGFIWGYTLINLACALWIDCLAHGRLAPSLLEFPVVKYLGKISYGLYVFHYPAQAVVARALPATSPGWQVGFQLCLMVLLSSISFHLLEAPFTRMKDVWFPRRAFERAVG